MPKNVGNFIAIATFGDKKYSMKAVIIPRVISPTNFFLYFCHSQFGILNFQSLHPNPCSIILGFPYIKLYLKSYDVMYSEAEPVPFCSLSTSWGTTAIPITRSFSSSLIIFTPFVPRPMIRISLT